MIFVAPAADPYTIYWYDMCRSCRRSPHNITAYDLRSFAHAAADRSCPQQPEKGARRGVDRPYLDVLRFKLNLGTPRCGSSLPPPCSHRRALGDRRF